MIIARIESLIAGKSVLDALQRADAYVEAGADGIMIHSKDKSGDDIREFCLAFREKHRKVPLVVVPTTYNHIYEEEPRRLGHKRRDICQPTLRAAYPAVKAAATSILENERSLEANPSACPSKKYLN